MSTDGKSWWNRKNAAKYLVKSDNNSWWNRQKVAKGSMAASPVASVQPIQLNPKFTIDVRFNKQNVTNAPRSPLTIALSGQKTSVGSAQYAFVAPVPATPPSATPGADAKSVQNALASGYRKFANKGAFFANYDSLAGLADQVDSGCGGCGYGGGLGLFGSPALKRNLQDEILTTLASGNLSEPDLLVSLRTKGNVSKWSFRWALYQLQKNNKVQRFIALVQAKPAPSTSASVSSALSGFSGWLFGF